jgi:Carboxylesterase family
MMVIPLVFLLASALAQALPHNSTNGIGGIVDTTIGPIQGKVSTLRPDVSAYLGIPFAKPPVGDLRFAAPVKYGGSGSVINGTAFVSELTIVPTSLANSV